MSREKRTQQVLVPKPIAFEIDAPASFKEKEPVKNQNSSYSGEELRAIKEACTRLGFTAGSFVCTRNGYDVQHGQHSRMMVTWVYDNLMVGSTTPFAPIECREIRPGVNTTRRFWPDELFLLWSSPSYSEMDEIVKEWAKNRRANERVEE